MIDANVIGSGPWLGVAVDATDVATPGEDDETTPLREPATGGTVQSHAARPCGNNVEPCVRPCCT